MSSLSKGADDVINAQCEKEEDGNEHKDKVVQGLDKCQPDDLEVVERLLSREQKAQPDDLLVVERLLSREQKANLHLALGRSASSPLQEKPPSTGYIRTFSSTVQSPREHPMRRSDSLENIAENIAEDVEKNELRKRVDSLQNEVVIFKAQNTELSKSLERSNTLLKEERRRRLTDRSPASTPVREMLSMEEEFQQELSLETITEQPATPNEHEDVRPPRRYSGERRRSAGDRKIPTEEAQPLSEENRRRSMMERQGSFADDEVKSRRNAYGQRKASMSLEDMYELFGVSKGGAPSTIESTG